MYSHVQLNQDNTFLRLIPAGELIEWDANNYCTAFALEKDGKADEFRVKPYFTTAEPAHNPIIQSVREIDPAPTDGNWTQQWEVLDKFSTYTTDNGWVHTKEEQEQAAIAADLASKKAAKITQINTLRDTKETDGFMYSDKLFQSDERSAARIANAALTASTALATGQPFTVDWAAADNTTVTLDGTGMLWMQAALTQRAAVLHYYSRSLKDAVAAATNATELDAIDINSGWPEL